ncbi:MAG: ABC transporter permease [Xanthomonadales bacterium]|nr:ABC transporter permease [Xanthomonadales bacterium]
MATPDTQTASDHARIQTRVGQASVYRVCGDLNLSNLAAIEQLHGLAQGQFEQLDLAELRGIDTAGAIALLSLLKPAAREHLDAALLGLDQQRQAFFQAVAKAMAEPCPESQWLAHWRVLFERLGRWTVTAAQQGLLLLSFVGQVVSTLLRLLWRPSRMRWTSWFHHMEATGLDAVPIVGLLTFLVGAVVAFLGATILQGFGAQIFTVELVSFSFLREFGVLLTAILLAGRSGSAFTAQIGAMKGNEEIDALKTMGVDPVEILVLPRLLALMVMLPVLTFLAMMLGIIGGAVAASLTMDISSSAYLVRLYERTPINYFWVGMVKAPVFAFIISVVGCLEGFKVSGSAESVGRHTTSSVVQSIFLVIFFDALFAIFFMELGI